MTTRWDYGTKEALIECPACGGDVVVPISYEPLPTESFFRGEDHIRVRRPSVPREVTCECGRITPLVLKEVNGGQIVLLRMI